MAALSYHEQEIIENTKRLRQMLKELPPFCADFFRGIEPRTSSRTRIAYAYDLKTFFDFLRQENPLFANCEMRDFSLTVLDEIQVMDFEEYMEFLKCHSTEKREDLVNTERGIMRKIASLKSFYNYFYRHERIKNNPAALVQLPKLHEKEIIRLEVDEVASLLDQVEAGAQLTEKQKAFHAKTKIRDLALMTLLLGTGIRVSECVGLNINDVDFNTGASESTEKAARRSSSTSARRLKMRWPIIWQNVNTSLPNRDMKTHYFYPFRKKGSMYEVLKTLLRNMPKL